ncbi:MAG: GGDEF domain-containing protein [Lysobacter sp.]|nr:MAG: GGDEF domain-containing protein [Lysobacter sp.]
MRAWLASSLRVPSACADARDAVLRARVRALAPVLAALTLGWIALDAAVMPTAQVARIGCVRVAIAAALLALSRVRRHLSAATTLRAFVWVQALGFGAIQLLLGHVDLAGVAGYGLFPFVIVAQLALFPAPWPHTLRAAIAPAAALALMLGWAGPPLTPADWRDAWLLVLLVGVAAWTAQAQLRLLVELLGARRDAGHDALTGLANRRNLDKRLATEQARALRHGTPLSVLMLDLDRFKRVNDEYGHAAGDTVLASAARALADELRAIDLGARFGGEEFVALLPDTPLDDATRAAERIRRRIAATPATYEGVEIPVTVSIGVAQWNVEEDTAGLIARADGALYAAKRDGRDRCVAATGSDAAATPARG